MTPPLIISASRLVTPDRVIEDGGVIVQYGRIQAVGLSHELPYIPGAERLDFPGKILAPGLIDLHIHGQNGYEAGADSGAIQVMADAICWSGVTSFLPTLSFAPTPEALCSRLQRAANEIGALKHGAQALGIYLEAPFLSPSPGTVWDRYPPSGLSAGKMARLPSVQELYEYHAAASGWLRIMAIAPELPGAPEVIAEIVRLGIVPSAAHTCASYEEMIQAVNIGLKSATHLYNGMRRQDHREPGVIEAVLACDALVAELIPDFIHVLPPAVEIALRCKGAERLLLVTDNTRFAGLPDGVYEDDQGRHVIKEQSRAYIPGWTLAGSVSPFNKNLRNLVEGLGITLPQAFRMGSLNPARLIGMDSKKGSLEPGKDADLIVIDDQIEVQAAIVGGRQVEKDT